MTTPAARPRGEVTSTAAGPADPTRAIKTWRYLRLSILLVLIGLFLSIAYEVRKTAPHCLQTSISAYYYTPVHGYFVGALVSVGLCLIALKGHTEGEDVMLNLAGMLVPVVAFVPTAGRGTCLSTTVFVNDQPAAIANNVFTLLAVGLIGLVVLGALLALERGRGMAVHRKTWFGLAVAVGLWTAATLLYQFDHHLFVANAHYTAAALFFGCISVVVVLNARGAKHSPTTRGFWKYIYLAIVAAMAISALGCAVAAWLSWTYALLTIEVLLCLLFAGFWTAQTVELWADGLRPPPDQP